ncbi:MAG: hypothetical protein ABSG53_07710, partial [Thermoguttaceae bacterium]
RAVITVVEKRLLSPVPALRYMVGHTGNDEPRQSCHAPKLPNDMRVVNTRIVSQDFQWSIPLSDDCIRMEDEPLS